MKISGLIQWSRFELVCANPDVEIDSSRNLKNVGLEAWKLVLWSYYCLNLDVFSCLADNEFVNVVGDVVEGEAVGSLSAQIMPCYFTDSCLLHADVLAENLSF